MKPIFDVPAPEQGYRLKSKVIGLDKDGDAIIEYEREVDENLILSTHFYCIPKELCIECGAVRIPWSKKDYYQELRAEVNHYTEQTCYCEECVKKLCRPKKHYDTDHETVWKSETAYEETTHIQFENGDVMEWSKKTNPALWG